MTAGHRPAWQGTSRRSVLAKTGPQALTELLPLPPRLRTASLIVWITSRVAGLLV